MATLSWPSAANGGALDRADRTDHDLTAVCYQCFNTYILHA
jgi:hypothetical protein